MADIGYFMSGEELAPAKIVTTAQAAERAGFDRVWVSDHYHPWMSSQHESPFVWSVLGAIATTTQLKMTTAVTCPTFRIHPTVIAQAAATTAALAPGRFSLGVGTGEALNEHIQGAAWPPVGVRLRRLEEALSIIRELWTGEVVTHEGEYYTVHDAKIWSLPETPPDILMSGFGPRSTDVAARIADGYISVTPDAELLRRYRDAGGTGPTQGGLKIAWAESEKEAAHNAHHLWGHEAGTGGQISQDSPMWMQFEAVAALTGPDDMAKALACGPDPDRAAEVIAAYLDAGYDEVYVAQVGQDQEGGIAFLAEEVLPLLAGRTGS